MKGLDEIGRTIRSAVSCDMSDKTYLDICTLQMLRLNSLAKS